MKLVYVAGKYTVGDTDQNVRIARDVAVKLWDLGFAVICPHTNHGYFENDCKVADYDDYLDGCHLMVKGCDILYMLPDWDESPGAKSERRLATTLDIPVVYSIPEIKRLKQHMDSKS